MKKREIGKGLLDLGKELTKNELKKIVGGATFYCSNGGVYYTNTTCQFAYCESAGNGKTQACY